MTPRHLRDLMDLIDCTEDAEQIRKWGRQSPLLGKYAWNRIVAIFSRRTGAINRAIERESTNDRYYNVVNAIAKRHER